MFSVYIFRSIFVAVSSSCQSPIVDVARVNSSEMGGASSLGGGAGSSAGAHFASTASGIRFDSIRYRQWFIITIISGLAARPVAISAAYKNIENISIAIDNAFFVLVERNRANCRHRTTVAPLFSKVSSFLFVINYRVASCIVVGDCDARQHAIVVICSSIIVRSRFVSCVRWWIDMCSANMSNVSRLSGVSVSSTGRSVCNINHLILIISFWFYFYKKKPIAAIWCSNWKKILLVIFRVNFICRQTTLLIFAFVSATNTNRRHLESSIGAEITPVTFFLLTIIVI